MYNWKELPGRYLRVCLTLDKATPSRDKCIRCRIQVQTRSAARGSVLPYRALPSLMSTPVCFASIPFICQVLLQLVFPQQLEANFVLEVNSIPLGCTDALQLAVQYTPDMIIKGLPVKTEVFGKTQCYQNLW